MKTLKWIFFWDPENSKSGHLLFFYYYFFLVVKHLFAPKARFFLKTENWNLGCVPTSVTNVEGRWHDFQFLIPLPLLDTFSIYRPKFQFTMLMISTPSHISIYHATMYRMSWFQFTVPNFNLPWDTRFPFFLKLNTYLVVNWNYQNLTVNWNQQGGDGKLQSQGRDGKLKSER